MPGGRKGIRLRIPDVTSTPDSLSQLNTQSHQLIQALTHKKKTYLKLFRIQFVSNIDCLEIINHKVYADNDIRKIIIRIPLYDL